MDNLLRRIIDISYAHKMGHLSSTLSAAPIIDEIYSTKKPDEKFILSSGHAALGLYVVLEKHLGIDAEMLLEKHGVHPHKDPANDIHCSTGSLGMGLTVAVGHALADRTKKVYCLISDGECGEGSIWEALRFIVEARLDNLEVYVNVNGMIAYDFIDVDYLERRLKAFLPRIKLRYSTPKYPWAEGVLSHYYVLKEEDYNKL